MDLVPLILFLLFLTWLLVKIIKNMATPKPLAPAEQAPPANNQASRDAIQRIIDICSKTGGDAFDALIICAAADGKVSRDELRIITWFCSFRGAEFSSADLDQIDALNTGVSMRIKSDTTTDKVIAALTPDDAGEVLRLYAAISAIRKPWSRPSKTLTETLAALEARIALKP